MHRLRTLRTTLLIAALLAVVPACDGKEENRSGQMPPQAEQSGHPYLFITDSAFKPLKERIARGSNKMLWNIHEKAIAAADAYVKSGKTLAYQKDESGKRILGISRDALARIFNCAYAYRYTGLKKYLNYAVKVMDDVCSFPDWNPSHFLDVAEMSTAVAVGYDWLWADLKPEFRKKVEKAVLEYGFMPAAYKKYAEGVFRNANNWGQVLNGGITVAAIAMQEVYPDRSKALIARSIQNVLRYDKDLYAPDGIYTEGPGYWDYGTDFYIMMCTALQEANGSDAGLSDIPGFDKTGLYKAWTVGNVGKQFNYSDNGERVGFCPGLFYFAARFNDPSILLPNTLAPMTGADRLAPMFLLWADRCNTEDISQEGRKLFTGGGVQPLAIARTGWSKTDRYLAVKGGSASINHAHMDAGSFVYEADGVRWSVEPPYQRYAEIEQALKAFNASLWNMDQHSCRWRLAAYNNQFHSTLTVNDKQHAVRGSAPLLKTFDTDALRGASFDLTALFGGDLKAATRTACIVDGDHLEITDELTAPGDRPATVRWTLTTRAVPAAGASGITLEQDGKTCLLSASGAEGIAYGTFSADPVDLDAEVGPVQKKLDGIHLCGYTVQIPAGASVKLVTTLKTH